MLAWQHGGHLWLLLLALSLQSVASGVGSMLCRYCGYEVTTEGDSFTIAFHDAFDAVCWSLAMQQAMLEAGVCVCVLHCDGLGCGAQQGEAGKGPGRAACAGAGAWCFFAVLPLFARSMANLSVQFLTEVAA